MITVSSVARVIASPVPTANKSGLIQRHHGWEGRTGDIIISVRLPFVCTILLRMSTLAILNGLCQLFVALLVTAYCVTHLHASRLYGRAVCQRSSAVHSYGGGLELKAFTTAASISCLTGRQVAEDFSRRATHLNF